MATLNKIIEIELTNFCNGECPWCRNSSMTREKGYMSLDMVNTIIEKIKDRQDKIILHFYGESLMHPNFVEIVELFNQSGIRTIVNTNGLLLEGELLDNICSSSLSEINITMNRFDPREKVEQLISKASKDLKIELILLNVPNNNSKDVVRWFENLKKTTDKKITLKAEKYFDPENGNDCCLRNKNDECQFRVFNQYGVDWRGKIYDCIKDFNTENDLGYIDNLDNLNYENKLCRK